MESLKALVEEGLDVNQAPHMADGKGGSFEHPLFHHACIKGNREKAALLLERGCDPLAHDGRGQWAHHSVAACEDGLPMLQWLTTAFPIPVDEPATTLGGETGMTMLHCAATTGRLETVQWLVWAGADVLCGAIGFADEPLRPSQLAEASGHAPVAAYLREKEAEAEAALEAVARRARNEKRRQKQKKAMARKQQPQQGASGGAASMEAVAGGASGGGGWDGE